MAASAAPVCHVPDKAFSDGLPVAKGLGGKPGTRNTPTLLNGVPVPVIMTVTVNFKIS